MKILNFRPLVFFAVFMIAGIILGTYYFAGLISLLWLVFSLFVCALLIIICLIIYFVCKNNFSKRRVMKRVLLCVLAFVVGVASISIKNVNLSKTYIHAETYTIQARVCSIPTYYDDRDLQVVLLDDVVIELGTRTYYLEGKTKAYFENDYINYNIEIGNVIEFTGRVKSFSMTEENEINRKFYNLANDIYYSASGKSLIEILDEYRITIFESIKLNAKSIMDEKLDDDISAIGYGMLFGEDEYIDKDISTAYNNAGISHLLAVSGLHVGFVVLLLSVILKLLKINEKTTSLILILLLFIYVIICGFATSVVRAFIMTVCMLISKMSKKPYDSLSSLSLACIIILIFSPLDLFTVGFQLSFMAVLGIILLNPLLMRFFSKFLFEQFASSLSLSMSASIGIMPIMMISFEKVSILSVFTNMIVVPVASIGFMILFLGVILSMIIPALSVIIIPFDFIMKFVTVIAGVASKISINLLNVNVSTGILFFWIAIFVIISEYTRVKPWIKVVLVFLLTILTILIMLF